MEMDRESEGERKDADGVKMINLDSCTGVLQQSAAARVYHAAHMWRQIDEQ